MKKINSLCETDFLKVVFGFFAIFFLCAALAAPDRANMLPGLWQILTQTSKISTNYFAVGGYAATFLNGGLVGLIFLAFIVLTDAKPNQVTTLAFILTMGFCSWGTNILNIWPTVLGVALYCVVKKETFGANINAFFFSTGIGPLITDLLFRYPNAEWVGFHPMGVVLAMLVGLAIGFFTPAGLAFSATVHQGFDLYSAALPVGMISFFLQALLFKTMGVALPSAPAAETLQVASRMTANVFCCTLFGLLILAALLMGAKPRDYWNMMKDNEVASFSATYGNALFLMNVGVFGLFILGYYNLIGGTFNGVTFGIVFCMLSTCNAGSTPRSVFPILLGYVGASLWFQFLSGQAGGNFTGAINAQAIMVGLCYANGLSPITRKYGWEYAIVGSVMHYILVTSVPTLHGGYCLYNGGFTAALICLIYIPILQKLTLTKAQRAARKASVE